MPRRLTGVLICLLVSVVGWAQGESALLRTNEFQTKVKLARELGLDTLTAFKMQWKHCLSQLDALKVESKYRKTVAQRSEWIFLTVLTRRLPQQVSLHMEAEEKLRMDSLYRAVQQGADFDALAKQYSNDTSGGKMVWLPLAYLLQEWSACIASLKPEQVSRPFYSPLGIHMLRWTLREYREDFTSLNNSRLQVSEETLFDILLVASLENKYRKPAEYTEKDLEDWFKEHQKMYAWELPHYKGVVVHCRDKKEAKRIRKSLKKMEFEEWNALALNSNSQTVRMECGLFMIGSNPYVDKLVFKCGDYEPIVGFPYTFVMGKTLKKGPQTYRDIREKVVKDYIEAHKEDWLDRIKKNQKE